MHLFGQRTTIRVALVRGAACLVVLAGGCSLPPHRGALAVGAPPRIERLRDAVLSWPAPAGVDAVAGAVLLRDGAPVADPEIAIARSVLHTNPRIAPAYALLLAIETARSAKRNGLPSEFLAATLLQESAYDVEALSEAGAIGIAQFMPATAEAVGIDPYDPFAAISGAGRLLGSYVVAYRGQYADPFAAALAAYNAGPLAVERYHGVPPYAQTQEYVALIFDRWARIVSYELREPRRMREGPG